MTKTTRVHKIEMLFLKCGHISFQTLLDELEASPTIGACVEAAVSPLPHTKLGINWESDHDGDVPFVPWYKLGPAYAAPETPGITNPHLSLAMKRTARAEVAAGRAS